MGCCFLFVAMAAFLAMTCRGSVQRTGKLDPGFSGTQMNWIDNGGIFLLSNSSSFGFGFASTENATLFLLAVVHRGSSTVVWSANRVSPVTNKDLFTFDDTGNAFLQIAGGSTIWSTGTANKAVASMELWDSGNLVLLGGDRSTIWESFGYPTDTLLSNQRFSKGMKLASDLGSNNLSYTLDIDSGDLLLSADFRPPQPYWSARSDNRITINKDGPAAAYAVLVSNSWNFYGPNDALLWQFIFSTSTGDPNATWAAILGQDGSITFSALQATSAAPSSTKIPQDDCRKPSACDPYLVCTNPGRQCQCPPSVPSCRTATDIGSCQKPVELVGGAAAADGFSYPALPYIKRPFSSNATLDGCKSFCLKNCSCVAMFFEGNTGNCFLFDQIGSLVGPTTGANYTSYIKILSSAAKSSDGGGGSKMPVAVILVIATLVVISGMIFLGLRVYRKSKNEPSENLRESSEEEDNFLEGLSGMPLRFSYKDLHTATNGFSVKLGQGGFGSVYQGTLPDGTRVAVKKLEGIGQGKKEFRAEVSIIGSIHHLHLVRLRGFCAEGSHRLLAYEYMANGSLERWLFRKENGEFILDWDTRYSIALGTAKGLAYLHEDCDVKIVHCDIKPENVLLDDRFMAKVSDFGLAKLMTREQSHVFTTMRGTRGYLAPEWITNYAISEKSDVYSYGMVLLELIGGRKNYDPREGSERAHFPSYAFRMMEEGKVRDVLDSRLVGVDMGDGRVDVAVRVALWCVQDDMGLRPSMAKVVQMLEGVCSVPVPPVASPLGSRLYATFLKSTSEEGGTASSSGPSDCNSDAYISAVRLSGPR